MFLHGSSINQEEGTITIGFQDDNHNLEEKISSRKQWIYTNPPPNLPKNEYDYMAITEPLKLNFDNIKECAKMEQTLILIDNDNEKDENLCSSTFYDGTKMDGDTVILKHYYANYNYKVCLHPSVHQLFDRIGTRQRTITWTTIRRTKITASQLGSVLADSTCRKFWGYRFRNMYRNKVTLLRDKLRVDDIKPVDNSYKNMILNHGVVNESVAIRRAMDIYNIPILHEIDLDGNIQALDFGLLEHPKYHYLAGSPDGVTMDGSLIEVKCPWSDKKRRNMTAGMVPDQYYIQVQVLMEIMDLRQTYFINYAPPDSIRDEKCCITVVPRNKQFFNTLLLPLATDFHTELMMLMKQRPAKEIDDIDEEESKPNKNIIVSLDKREMSHIDFLMEAKINHPTFTNGSKLTTFVRRDSQVGTIHCFKVVDSDHQNSLISSYGCA